MIETADPQAAAELLERMSRRLSDERWTQCAIARTEDDRPTTHSDPAAVKLCIVGALNVEAARLLDDPDDLAGYDALRSAAMDAVHRQLDFYPNGLSTGKIVSWQDQPERSAADVRAVCDRAAADLRSRAPAQAGAQQ